MPIYDLKHNLELFSRPIPSLVETITYYNPEIGVSCIQFPNQTEYENLIWDSEQDKNLFPEQELVQKQVAYTIDLWIIMLMEEANQLQRAALALHTISRDYTLTQKNMYDVKYTASVEYVERVQKWQADNATQDLPTNDQVEIPSTIFNEASRTGDPVYYLCLAIIKNFVDSSETLSAFYGKVEGERRITKQRIKACTTIEELLAVEWASWPDYEGNPPAPTD